jgi:tetratricopeptide (TPR) repeat protein
MALHGWLPQVIQAVDPWTSEDISKGSVWNAEILAKLNESRIGIVCLTPENLDSRWLHFEAGMLARKPDQTHVCTFLLPGMKATDIPQPLAMFEATTPSKHDVRRLLVAINTAAAARYGKAVAAQVIDDALDRRWADLERRLRKIAASTPAAARGASRLSELADEISRELARAGFDAPTVVSGVSLSEAPLEVQLNVRRLLGEISGGIEQLSPSERARVFGGEDHRALFEMARGLIAETRWVEAARYLDEYVEIDPHDWRAQKWRGIAHAMSRQGHAADAAALDAYKHAIASVPRGLDRNKRALLFNYRGAMFKRLGRYKEALVDLTKAEKLADDDMLLNDIHYNLACVYALTGKRDEAVRRVRQLIGTRREMDLVRRHMNDYFRSLATDREFVGLLRPPADVPTKIPHVNKSAESKRKSR